MLALESSEILDSTISGSTFSALAVPADAPSGNTEFATLFGDEDDISPREVSLFLGNSSAFRLLESGETPDDGMLHLAAMLALPDFVRWLLNWHDPNYPAEDYDSMVPLALACFSKPVPWCRVKKSDWAERLKETMKLLIPKTDKRWRRRGKLALHIALDSGLDVTRAMAEALSSVPDRSVRREKFLYTDKTGKHYNPAEYVENFLEGTVSEKQELKECLRNHDIY